MASEKDYCYIVEGKLEIPFKYAAGRFGSRFLTALRDEKKILAVRCDRCDKVFLPPRRYCTYCYSDLDGNWVEVADEGEVVSFTVVRYREPYQPKDVPYVIAQIKLDGADTPMLHIISGVAPEQVRCGMRVRAVWSDERTASMFDIAHFEPI